MVGSCPGKRVDDDEIGSRPDYGRRVAVKPDDRDLVDAGTGTVAEEED